MRAIRLHLTTAAILVALQGFAGTARAAEHIGMLECTVASGVGLVVMSNKSLACTFWPERGRPEYYVGTMRRVGLDIGITGPGVLNWGVFAVGTVAPRFALAGAYAGAVSELAVGAGLGANALVGGSGNAISLQPLSLNAAFGVSLAAGVGEVILEPAPPSAIH